MRSRLYSSGIHLLPLLLWLVAAGCGGRDTVCKLTSISISPAAGVADHTLPAPGNMQHFDAFDTSSTPGCVHTTANLTNATWAVSDTINASISNAQDATYGTATCHGSTASPITVTATVPVGDGTNVSNTGFLVCK